MDRVALKLRVGVGVSAGGGGAVVVVAVVVVVFVSAALLRRVCTTTHKGPLAGWWSDRRLPERKASSPALALFGGIRLTKLALVARPDEDIFVLSVAQLPDRVKRIALNFQQARERGLFGE